MASNTKRSDSPRKKPATSSTVSKSTSGFPGNAGNPVLSFRGDFRCFSNFHPSPIGYEGVVYPTVEHAFQAAKTLEIRKRKEAAAISSPHEVKAWGQKVTLRPDWERVKVSIMEELCYQKFKRHEDCQEILLDTGNAHLEEGNHHGDKFWGTVDGNGRNELGKVLMRVRARLRQEAAQRK